MQKFRKGLIPIAVVSMVAIIVFLLMKTDLKHIEDTNGPDNIRPVTITDADIIDMKMGALNPGSVNEMLVGSGLNFSSNRFTGVHEILYANYVLPSDFDVSISTLSVSSGNFRMVVVHDGKIVAEITPDSEELIANVRLENITGTVSLRIVGESADYSFQMSASEYDTFNHP